MIHSSSIWWIDLDLPPSTALKTLTMTLTVLSCHRSSVQGILDYSYMGCSYLSSLAESSIFEIARSPGRFCSLLRLLPITGCYSFASHQHLSSLELGKHYSSGLLICWTLRMLCLCDFLCLTPFYSAFEFVIWLSSQDRCLELPSWQLKCRLRRRCPHHTWESLENGGHFSPRWQILWRLHLLHKSRKYRLHRSCRLPRCGLRQHEAHLCPYWNPHFGARTLSESQSVWKHFTSQWWRCPSRLLPRLWTGIGILWHRFNSWWPIADVVVICLWMGLLCQAFRWYASSLRNQVRLIMTRRLIWKFLFLDPDMLESLRTPFLRRMAASFLRFRGCASVLLISRCWLGTAGCRSWLRCHSGWGHHSCHSHLVSLDNLNLGALATCFWWCTVNVMIPTHQHISLPFRIRCRRRVSVQVKASYEFWFMMATSCPAFWTSLIFLTIYFENLTLRYLAEIAAFIQHFHSIWPLRVSCWSKIQYLR